MDAFILAFRNLCSDLLPIIGAVCLVCLIILLIKVIKVLSSVDETLLKTHVTIDLVDRSIEKVQAPLDTAVKVSSTVDKAHDAAINAVKEASDFIVSNAGEIKEKVLSYIGNDDEKDAEEEKEPSPEDIIGG